jgi:hypothetical protein
VPLGNSLTNVQFARDSVLLPRILPLAKGNVSCRERRPLPREDHLMCPLTIPNHTPHNPKTIMPKTLLYKGELASPSKDDSLFTTLYEGGKNTRRGGLNCVLENSSFLLKTKHTGQKLSDTASEVIIKI